jgi:hypothetical protein
MCIVLGTKIPPSFWGVTLSGGSHSVPTGEQPVLDFVVAKGAKRNRKPGSFRVEHLDQQTGMIMIRAAYPADMAFPTCFASRGGLQVITLRPITHFCDSSYSSTYLLLTSKSVPRLLLANFIPEERLKHRNIWLNFVRRQPTPDSSLST